LEGQSSTAGRSADRAAGVRPKEGFVPDKETAIAIARAVLIPIYGAKQIESEEPLLAHLESGVWTVEGTLSAGNRVIHYK
jgi:hypothetical protein